MARLGVVGLLIFWTAPFALAQQDRASGTSPAAGIGLPTFGDLTQGARSQVQPGAGLTDLMSRPVTTDVFAGRADPRALQTGQGATGTGTTNRFGLNITAGRLPGMVRGGFFGRGAFGGRGFGGTTQRRDSPSFVVRLAPPSAGMEPPPSIRRYGGQPPRRLVPPVVATLQRINGVRTVNVTMEGGRAVLTGIVETEQAKRMAELIVRLEPGVRSVENRIQVVAVTP